MSNLRTVGIFPAVGRATRLGEISGSKETLPVGPGGRPVGRCLLDSFAAAGLDRVYVVLREGKEDIATTFGDGEQLGASIAYLPIAPTPAIPYTVAAALPRDPEARWVLGFPDILFRPRDAVARLLEALEEGSADVVLGLFPSDNPGKADMVELDPEGRICAFHIKPSRTDLRFTWILAAWRARFSRYLEGFLTRVGPDPPSEMLAAGELQISTILTAAIREGLEVRTLTFPEGDYLDIGTPDDLARAVEKPERWIE